MSDKRNEKRNCDVEQEMQRGERCKEMRSEELRVPVWLESLRATKFIIDEKQWKDFSEMLDKLSDDSNPLFFLNEFERKVVVYDDHHSEKEFHEFSHNDTYLNIILRNSPPDSLLENIERILPVYKASRRLYKIAQNTDPYDFRWIKFANEFNKLELRGGGDGYGLNREQIRQVFTIRHCERKAQNEEGSPPTELTILMESLERNPPAAIIAEMLEVCREAASIPHIKTGKLPISTAIIHQARTEVITKLLLDEKERKNFEARQNYDYFTNVDHHGRNLLHCAAYFNASRQCIKALRNVCCTEGVNDVLCETDNQNRVPYEVAIWQGRPMDYIECLFVPGVNGKDTFEEVVAHLARSVFESGHSSLEMEGIRISLHNKKQLRVKNSYSHYDFIDYHLPSILTFVSKNERVQKVITKSLIHNLPTVVKIADLYNFTLIIVSYTICSNQAAVGDDVSNLWLHILTFSFAYMTLRESLEMIASIDLWLGEGYYIYEAISICLLGISIQSLWTERFEELGDIAVVTTAVIYLKFIFFLRSTFMSFALFVTGLLRILKDLIPFTLVLIIILLMFSEMLRLIVSSECRHDSGMYDEFCTRGDSLLATYGYFVEGVSVDEYVATNSAAMITTIIIFAFFVVVILLNVVIAIVSDSWQDAKRKGPRVLWKHRLNFLIAVKRYRSWFRLISHYKFGMLEKLLENNTETEYGRMQSTLQQIDLFLQNTLCKCIWFEDQYFGNFESFFDRMVNNDIYSFKWTLNYNLTAKRVNIETEHGKLIFTIKTIIKAICLQFVFWTFMTTWFVVGLATFGILWPKFIRRRILASTALEKNAQSDFYAVGDFHPEKSAVFLSNHCQTLKVFEISVDEYKEVLAKRRKMA